MRFLHHRARLHFVHWETRDLTQSTAEIQSAHRSIIRVRDVGDEMEKDDKGNERMDKRNRKATVDSVEGGLPGDKKGTGGGKGKQI